MAVAPAQDVDVGVDTLVIGAGACGMTAALAAHAAGREVLVLERDAVPAGSTALSAGLIPAAGTRYQRAAGITDDAATFAADIQRKAGGANRPEIVAALSEHAAGVLEWLADAHALAFSLVDDFDYPGHTHRRMHGLPSRAGRALIDALRAACERAAIDIVCARRVETLLATADGRVTGVRARRPDGGAETIGCARLILACNGFGANPALVSDHMPQIADALYFGHPGNEGDALRWGAALGAAIRHPGAYQGHGNVAHPHGILITWAVISEGGFQLNRDGVRFWNEAQGYSEAARAVLAEPGGTAVTVFDDRIADIARQFADFRAAEDAGAVRRFDSIAALAAAFDLPEGAVAQTVAAVDAARRGAPDAFGRAFAGTAPLAAPFCAARVTGALFHTQGGLDVTPQGRVLRRDGTPLPNLYAAGGAACGVSGTGDAGYLSGNGLLSAVVLGFLAGSDATPP